MAESDKKDPWAANIPSLKKELECPVCLETVIPPVRQCMNGHVTCTTCADELTDCALCAQPFMKNNSTFINNLLAALPRPCKYAQGGCQEFVVTGDKHEDYCGFREVLCRSEDCTQKVKVNTFVTHYEEVHFNRLSKAPEGEFLWTPFNPHAEKSLGNVPIVFDGILFYICLYKKATGRFWENLFQANFTHDPAQKYFVNVKFERGNFIASHSLSAIHNHDEGSTLDEIVSNIVEKNAHQCMRVDQQLLHSLTTKDQKLSVKYSIFKQ